MPNAIADRISCSVRIPEGITPSLIIILSDGDLHDKTESIRLANEIKSKGNISLSTIFLETNWSKYSDFQIPDNYNEMCLEALSNIATEKTLQLL